MRRLALLILFVVVAAIATPVVFLGGGGNEDIVETPLEGGPEIKVLLCETGQVVDLSLEEYVVGVVAAEMPAAFPEEALKAQSIAARTYTLKRVEGNPGTNTGTNANQDHPQGDICNDFNHCQAWIDKDEMRNRWGKSFDEYYGKICSAVAATKGLAIYYQNALIDPVYHSTSNGKTENSEEVWGTMVPYLRSVPSPWDKASPRFQGVVEMPWEEINQKVASSEGAVPVSTSSVSGGRKAVIRPLEYTSSGRLKRVQVGNAAIDTTQLRLALGLPSTDLKWTVKEGKVTFVATGNGHGVGMSQYGAKGMALEGNSCEKILCHYYTGVTVDPAY